MLDHAIPIACDIVAITIVATTYFRRHQRRDLLLAYVALNVGVLSATATLTSASVGAGLGLGLFGILSIIRLRSDSITQEEIAYYFVALVLGLLAGVGAEPTYLVPVLCALLVLVMYVADHPRLLPRARHQLLTLDAAISDESALREHIERRLGVEVRHCIVQQLDFVRDLTVVDVRYRVPRRPTLLVAAPEATHHRAPADATTPQGAPAILAGRNHVVPTASPEAW